MRGAPETQRTMYLCTYRLPYVEVDEHPKHSSTFESILCTAVFYRLLTWRFMSTQNTPAAAPSREHTRYVHTAVLYFPPLLTWRLMSQPGSSSLAEHASMSAAKLCCITRTLGISRNVSDAWRGPPSREMTFCRAGAKTGKQKMSV